MSSIPPRPARVGARKRVEGLARRTQRPILPADMDRLLAMATSLSHAASLLDTSVRRLSRFARAARHPQGGSYLEAFQRLRLQKRSAMKRGFVKRAVLEAILTGQRPNFIPKAHRLKAMLLFHGFLTDRCESCGHNHQRSGDYRVATALYFLDGDARNGKQDNLQLLCYNCLFAAEPNPRRFLAILKADAYPEADSQTQPTPTGPEPLPPPVRETIELKFEKDLPDRLVIDADMELNMRLLGL